MLVVVAGLFLATLAWANTPQGTPIEEILRARDLQLADAYWLAGERYIELNKVEIGRAMQQRARQIVPGYLPPNQREQDASPARALTPAPAEAVVSGLDEQELLARAAEGRRIARLQFNRLLRGFLSEEPDTLRSALAASVEVPGQGTLRRDDVIRRLDTLFRELEIESLTPEQVVVLDSLEAEVMVGTQDDVVVVVNSSPDAPEFLKRQSWWGRTFSLYFIREGNNWFLKAFSTE